MGFKSRVSNKFFSLIVLLCISRVCYGQLMCYVCDDCAHVTADTPLLECNEDFFHTGGSTASSVQTTTDLPKTTAAVTGTTEETTSTPSSNNTEESTTSTEETSTTESKSSESTTKLTTAKVTETSATTPTASTILKLAESTQRTTSTTTAAGLNVTVSTASTPMPTESATVRPLDDVENLNNQTVTHVQHVNKDEVEDVDIEQGVTKSYKPTAEFRVRQLRSVDDVRFNCFKVDVSAANGKMVINRGCARVSAGESACEQWETQHPNEKMKNCHACSLTKCNGSSALHVSVTALVITVMAVFIQWK